MSSMLQELSVDDVLSEIASPCDSVSNGSFSTVGPESTFSSAVEPSAKEFTNPQGIRITKEERERQERRERLLHGPSRVNLDQDRQKIRAHRQLYLNQFILRETKACNVSREDHHIMLKQLIATAYRNDPHRKERRQEWRQLVASVGKEYWGASAILSLSPDPYHTVLAKLSSMMLWDDKCRRWTYAYSDEEIVSRRARQEEVLSKLNATGSLFL